MGFYYLIITLKLTMLLCLVTAQRSQTLHLLKLSNMISEGQNMKQQFETILFPQDMIQDIYVTLEYNT